ncbi:MAG: MFS transporter, partial [Oligoflexales bacterium]|nr:MFS transporter [Oligoflexales bacterium]
MQSGVSAGKQETGERSSDESCGKDPRAVKKREILGWAMFDFANSGYTTVVISVMYSGVFSNNIVPAESALRTTYWSISMIISTVIAMVLSPWVGAICDYSGHKKYYLAASAVVCSLFTALLFFVNPGDVWLAVMLVAVSNAGFMLSESFCGSFLTDLATKKNMGRISGIGWAIGYFGGLASLLVYQQMVTVDQSSGLYMRQVQWAMVGNALFFLVGSIPTFVFVRERARARSGFESVGASGWIMAGYREIKRLFAIPPSHRNLLKFLLAFMVYYAGLEVVIKFVGIYTQAELHMNPGELVTLFLILQVSAALGSVCFGVLEAYIGPKNTVLATLVWWVMGTLGIFFLKDIALFVS